MYKQSVFYTAARLVIATSLALALSGCLSEPNKRGLEPATQDIAAAAQQVLPPATPKPYRLQIGDVLDIKLVMNPELNDEVSVRPDGMISTAIAHDVPAYGRTVSELQTDLEARYNKDLLNPKISVIVRSVAPTRVYVLGEVNNPGEFINVGPSLTLLQAIARAGGVKNSAGTNKIIIIRRSADDKPEALAANYMSAVSGRSPQDDVRLSPYDVVYVPRSDVGDAYLYFQQYVQQFVPLSFSGNYQVNPTTTIR